MTLSLFSKLYTLGLKCMYSVYSVVGYFNVVSYVNFGFFWIDANKIEAMFHAGAHEATKTN